MKAKDYFNKKARTYNKERDSGIVGSLVKKEKKLVLKLLAPKKNERILDAGCGSGYYSTIIKDRGAIPFGVDISQNMIDELRKRGIKGKVADLENLKLKKRFDKILCAGALEFTRTPKNVFESLNKNLKKNGILVLIYPKPSLAGYAYLLFHLSHHVRIRLFPKKTIKKLVRSSGFRVLTVKRTDPICNIAVLRKIGI